MYLALASLSVTLHVSDPYPTPKNPNGYALSSCSGVFIGPDLILTANHCISDSRGRQWIKTAEGISYSVSIVKGNKYKDLALLRVIASRPINHAYAQLGTPAVITQDVFTVNSGKGFVQTYARGYVANLIADPDHGTGSILHTAPIMGGASGSGLFDNRGRLIGINTATFPAFSVAVDLTEIQSFLNKN